MKETSEAAPKCIFGEYELSPSLIGLSLLPSPHPELFNAYWCGPPSGVTRTSPWTRVDHLFRVCNIRLQHALSDSLSLRLRASLRLTSPDIATRRCHYAKGTPSQHKLLRPACRRTGSGTLSLPCQGCFSPFPHGTGSLSVSCEYLALADGPAGFMQDSSCPALLRITLHTYNNSRKGFHPLRRNFPEASALIVCTISCSYNPRHASTSRVWANPLSLAATRGIILIFSSCRY